MKSRINENESRVQKVLNRKEEQIKEDMKRKLFLLKKWDILKIKVTRVLNINLEKRIIAKFPRKILIEKQSKGMDNSDFCL